MGLLIKGTAHHDIILFSKFLDEDRLLLIQNFIFTAKKCQIFDLCLFSHSTCQNSYFYMQYLQYDFKSNFTWYMHILEH